MLHPSLSFSLIRTNTIHIDPSPSYKSRLFHGLSNMDELPTSSIDDEEQQEDMIESDNNPHYQETISRQAYMPRLVVDFQQPNMQLTHFVQHAEASSNVPTTRRHSATQDMPPRSREQILQRYQNELQSLNGHWNSICIALTSIRSSYLAVLSSISTSESQQQPSESSESPTASSTCTSSTSSPTPIQQIPVTDFLIPSAVAVTSFMISRSDTTTQSDLEQELLLAVDDAMFQIRQLEVRIERLEAHIQELHVQSVHHRQQ